MAAGSLVYPIHGPDRYRAVRVLPTQISIAVARKINHRLAHTCEPIRKLQLLNPHQHIDAIIAVREIIIGHRKATNDFCDGVLALQSRELRRIQPRAAIDGVVAALPPDDIVVAVASKIVGIDRAADVLEVDQRVDAGPAVDGVACCQVDGDAEAVAIAILLTVVIDPVSASAAIKDVVAHAALQFFVAGAAGDGVAEVGTHHALDACQGIGTDAGIAGRGGSARRKIDIDAGCSRGIHGVIETAAAVDGVIAATAFEELDIVKIRIAAGQGVVMA